jgi:hypothetical protein
MPKYQLEVKEILSRIVEVEAEDEKDAIEKIEYECNEGVIELDYNDFKSREVYIF